MDEAIIDSDIVSELIKAKNPRVLHIGAHYLSQHQRFAFSAITFYEVCRGFLSIGAVARLTKFVQFAAASDARVASDILSSCRALVASVSRGPLARRRRHHYRHHGARIEPNACDRQYSSLCLDPRIGCHGLA